MVNDIKQKIENPYILWAALEKSFQKIYDLTRENIILVCENLKKKCQNFLKAIAEKNYKFFASRSL